MIQPIHAERPHSKWNSSGASRWTVCFGQPNKCENLPKRPPTKYNLEGTAAHEILELCLEAFQKNERADPSRFTNAPAIIQSVAIVVDYLTILRTEHPDLIVENERRVWFPQDHVPKEACGGTLDIFAHSPSARRVWIIDFKHGEGVPVEVVGNKQLLSYACARLWGTKIDYIDIVLVVIQPRCRHRLGPVRDWTVSYVELADFINEIDAALAIGKRKDAPLVAGDHCRWCDAEHACEARDKLALESMRQDFAHVKDLDLWEPPAPQEMPLEKMLTIYRHADQIRAWLNAIEGRLIGAAVHEGIELPGFKVVEAQSRRAFVGEPAAVAQALVALSGHRLALDDVYARKLIGITEATTRLVQFATADAPHGWKEKAATAMRDQIAALTDRKSSGNLTLAADTDSRPSTSKIAQQLGHVPALLEPIMPAPELQSGVAAYGAMLAAPRDPKTLIEGGT